MPTSSSTRAPGRSAEVTTSRHLVFTAAIGPVLLAVGWVLTSHLPNSPLWISVLRVLPAGLILLLLRPARPTGAWWYRSIILGATNFGGFFYLQAVAVHHLTPGVAATIASTQALLVPFGAILLISTPLRTSHLLYAMTGILGVTLIAVRGGETLHGVGIAAAVGTALCNALGLLLTRRWSQSDDAHHLTTTGWQMIAGGLVLLPAAVFVEGTAPRVTAEVAVTMAVVIVCTASAFGIVFGTVSAGLAPTTVSRLMLLCPVVVTIVDVLVYQRPLTPLQALGTTAVLLPVIAACWPSTDRST